MPHSGAGGVQEYEEALRCDFKVMLTADPDLRRHLSLAEPRRYHPKCSVDTLVRRFLIPYAIRWRDTPNSKLFKSPILDEMIAKAKVRFPDLFGDAPFRRAHTKAKDMKNVKKTHFDEVRGGRNPYKRLC